MYEKLSEKDIQFMEAFYDPVSLIENLIPENIDAPGTWDKDCECIVIRNYQFMMLSYEYLYADDDQLTPKQNFESKIPAGKIINIAARNIGKSYLGFDADGILTIVHYSGDESCIASFDDDHLTARVNRVAGVVDHHKFFEMYKIAGKKQSVSRKEGITTRNGHKMKKANENVKNKQTVGEKFHGMHFKKFLYDEYSYTTNKGEEKRVDSKHSYGVIERLFGIADLRSGSPLGKKMSNEANRNFICRIPQYVREDWDENSKADAAEKYDGVSSDAYKLNVEAEILQGASNKFDIDVIKKKCYNRTEQIKYFEINKDNFDSFESIINIDRIPCEKVYVCSDLGFGGSPSEIIIIFDRGDKVKKRFKYVYQISVFGIRLPEEQAKVFKYIYDCLGSAYIAVDCSEIGGKTVRQELIKSGVPSIHLSDFDFKKSLEVGIKKNRKGEVITDDKGNVMVITERTKVWAVQTLEKLFYHGKIEIVHQEKFFKQFSNYIEKKLGNGSTFASLIGEDHLLDSFLFFALAQWENEYKNDSDSDRPKRCLGII